MSIICMVIQLTNCLPFKKHYVAGSCSYLRLLSMWNLECGKDGIMNRFFVCIFFSFFALNCNLKVHFSILHFHTQCKKINKFSWLSKLLLLNEKYAAYLSTTLWYTTALWKKHLRFYGVWVDNIEFSVTGLWLTFRKK